MTDEPSQRPDFQHPDSQRDAAQKERAQRDDASQASVPPPGYEPPKFVPPYGSDTPPPPPYGQPAWDQHPYAAPYPNTGQYPGPAQPPYAQPPYPQPGSPYGYTGYYGAPAEPKSLSIASMVCGIASVIMGWLLLPQIAAIVTGHLALKREPSGKGMSITGLVLGYLCLLGYGAFWLLAIGLAVAGSTSGGTF